MEQHTINIVEIEHQQEKCIEVIDHIWLQMKSNTPRAIEPLPDEPCIFKVHEGLRHVNEKAYTPMLVSIGPYHHGHPKLLPMEKHKEHYLELLLQRNNQRNEEYLDSMKKFEERARKYYVNPIDYVSSDEFVKMMLIDACFVIEFFVEHSSTRPQKETCPKMPCVIELEEVGVTFKERKEHKPSEEEDDDKAAEVAGEVAGEPDIANEAVISRLKGKGELVVEGSWSNTSAVAETIFCAGNSNDEGTCAVESSLPASVECNHFPKKGAPVASIAPSVDGQLLTPSFIKSLSESFKGRPGICLEVNLGHGHSGLQPTALAQVDLQPMGPLSSCSPAAKEAPQSKINTTISPSIPGSIRNRLKKGK
ncbi:UPF0481 protein [Camellia lanceoleosa]|uniref:UPF0481 protein n=1 Tax=Camellia lanceoleosa TaxID=1840588 RepID=A0ACC0GDZ4_9ERIC|nr:UPF0481 protein [Camellia lanceoleosa]